MSHSEVTDCSRVPPHPSSPLLVYENKSGEKDLYPVSLAHLHLSKPYLTGFKVTYSSGPTQQALKKTGWLYLSHHQFQHGPCPVLSGRAVVHRSQEHRRNSRSHLTVEVITLPCSETFSLYVALLSSSSWFSAHRAHHGQLLQPSWLLISPPQKLKMEITGCLQNPFPINKNFPKLICGN